MTLTKTGVKNTHTVRLNKHTIGAFDSDKFSKVMCKLGQKKLTIWRHIFILACIGGRSQKHVFPPIVRRTAIKSNPLVQKKGKEVFLSIMHVQAVWCVFLAPCSSFDGLNAMNIGAAIHMAHMITLGLARSQINEILRRDDGSAQTLEISS